MYRQIDDNNDNILSINSNENIINENMEIETTRTLHNYFILSKTLLTSNILFLMITCCFLINIYGSDKNCVNNNNDYSVFLLFYLSFLISDILLNILYFKLKNNKIYKAIRIFLLLTLFYFLVRYFSTLLWNDCTVDYINVFFIFIYLKEIMISLIPFIIITTIPSQYIARNIMIFSNGLIRFGSDDEEIKKIPTYVFDPNLISSEGVSYELQENNFIRLNENDSCCIICFHDYKEDDLIKVLGCNHFYHQKCIDEWLKISPTCPTCRKSI